MSKFKYNFTREQMLDAQQRCGTLEKIAIEFGCSWKVIRKFMRIYNIPYSRPSVNFDKQTVIDLYAKYQSFAEIARHLNVPAHQIKYFFDRENINYKHLARYDYNHDCFSTMTPESFYWAGFLAADGNITNNSTRCELAIIDQNHVEKLANFGATDKNITINTRKPVQIRDYEIKTRKSASISFYSKQIVKDLENNFGIVPAKSLIYNLPEKMWDHENIRHFIRGYIDGDGSWFKITKNKHLALKVLGTKEFLTNLTNHFTKILNLNKDKYIGYPGGCYAVSYGGTNTCSKIYKYLYNGADLYLQRKYDFLQEFFKNYEPKHRGKNFKDFSNLIGKTFSKLTILEISPNISGERRLAKISCECGVIKNMRLDGILNGHAKSCGNSSHKQIKVIKL